MSDRMHWTPQRKANLVEDVRFGRQERAAVMSQFNISEQEFAAWEAAYQATGVAGLATGFARPQAAIPVEEAAPWRSAAAPSTPAELSDWFASQAMLLHQLAATYGKEAKLLLERGMRGVAIEKMDVARTVAAQARSYEHAAHLIAALSGAQA